MKNFRIDKNNALIFIIAGLSIANIVIQLRSPNYLSILNSAIGLTGVTLFVLKKGSFRFFIWAWIIAQAITINHTFIDSVSGSMITRTVWNLAQVSDFEIGFFLSGDTNSYGFNFNAVVILYFFLFRNLKTSSHIGRTIGLLFLKGNLDLDVQPATTATLGQRVDLDGDDNWLLGHLNEPIVFNKAVYDRVLVHT